MFLLTADNCRDRWLAMFVPAAVMLGRSRMAFVRRPLFILTTGDELMVLRAARPIPTLESVVGMHVGAAISPIPAPMRAGDEQFVPIPEEVRSYPIPRGQTRSRA